jgi:hypothetical protein
MGTYGRMARCNPNPLHIIRSFAHRAIVFKRDQTGFALGAQSRNVLFGLTMPPPFHGNHLFFPFVFSGLVSV